MRIALCLSIVFAGVLTAPVLAEDLTALRTWKNHGGEVIEGRMLDVTANHADILCDEKVYEIPLYDFSGEDQRLLREEYARRNPSSVQAQPVVSSPPVSQPVYQRHFNDPAAIQERLRAAEEARMAQQRQQQQWRNSARQGPSAYNVGQYAGFGSIIAFVIGLLYRFLRD